MASLPLAPGRQRGWHEFVTFLPGALALVLSSLVSGGLGALIVLRLLYPSGPSFWHLVRIVFFGLPGGTS